MNSMKNLNFKILAVICLLALGSMDLFSFTVKWKVTEGNWSDMYVYAWQIDNNSELFGGWPGTKVNVGNDGWYSASITDGLTVGIVINGGNGQPQLGDMKPLSADACFNVNLQARTFTLVNCSTGEPNPTPAYTIKWKAVAGAWDEMYIYSYAGNPEKIYGEWPGTKIDANSNGWYAVTIPEGQTAGRVIFNNGDNGSQLPGQGEEGIAVTESACFELDLIQLIPPTLIDCSLTGIENIQPGNIAVYSDLSGKLEIRSEKEVAKVDIYNAAGKRVISDKNTCSVNVNSLETGVYLLYITFADGAFHSQKIVKK
jgi:hypothetical protein